MIISSCFMTMKDFTPINVSATIRMIMSKGLHVYAVKMQKQKKFLLFAV